jgi:hypothetical protein
LKEGNAVPIYLRLNHEQSDASRKYWSETPKPWNELPVDKVPLDEQLDIGRVVEALRARDIDADASPEVAALVQRVIAHAQPGDVILVMSNGSFGGFISSLLEGLEAKKWA